MHFTRVLVMIFFKNDKYLLTFPEVNHPHFQAWPFRSLTFILHLIG